MSMHAMNMNVSWGSQETELYARPVLLRIK